MASSFTPAFRGWLRGFVPRLAMRVFSRLSMKLHEFCQSGIRREMCTPAGRARVDAGPVLWLPAIRVHACCYGLYARPDIAYKARHLEYDVDRRSGCLTLRPAHPENVRMLR